MKTWDKRRREYSSRCWQLSMIISHCCSAWTCANKRVQRQYIGCCVSVSYPWQRISHCIALLPSASACTGYRAADDWPGSVRCCQSRGLCEQRHLWLARASVQAAFDRISGTVNASSFSVNRCPQILQPHEERPATTRSPHPLNIQSGCGAPEPVPAYGRVVETRANH